MVKHYLCYPQNILTSLNIELKKIMRSLKSKIFQFGKKGKLIHMTNNATFKDDTPVILKKKTELF